MLKRATFRHIEAEIYSYEETKEYIKKLRDAIIEGSTQNNEYIGVAARSGYKTSSVEIKGTLLADHILLNEMTRITDAIQKVYKHLPESKQKLMELKYWSNEDYTIEQLAEKLNISESTVKRWRQEIVYRVAMMLGWR